MANVIEYLQAHVTGNLDVLYRLRAVDVACVLGFLYALLRVTQTSRRQEKTSSLRGPSSPSSLWGVEQVLQRSPDAGAEYEKWTEEYGGAYEIPTALGGTRVVLTDPKAIAHFYAGGASMYNAATAGRIGTEHLVGKGLLTATGDSHRRQRKTFTPAFSNAAIRNITSVFYDSAYKLKGVWESLIESNGGGCIVIDVQNWMKHLSLDAIGVTGFSYDFGSLDGKRHAVGEVLTDLGNIYSNTKMLIFMPLAMAIPWLLNVPTPYTNLIRKLNDAMGEIAGALLAKTRKEKDAGVLEKREEDSILGLLIKAETQEGQLSLTRDEATAQAKVLLLAGYDTTSIALSWLLIDLCKNPHVQTKLRAELLDFGADPKYDQLSTCLPYLDAVIHETLRMHPPHTTTVRMTADDDVVPLSKPVRTQSGRLVDHVTVNKGSCVVVPIASVNRSTAFWGPDAKEYKPERWMAQDGIPAAVKDIQGHRHLLTFIDGPRICPGRGFAIAELKMVLSVLLKNFVFEFVNGPETEIGMAGGLVPRPKVAGERGDAVPMRVRRFE